MYAAVRFLQRGQREDTAGRSHGAAAGVEVLPSDFAGNGTAVDRVVDAAPEVYNHNTETVPRLYPKVRGRKADYRWTLEMFRRIKRRNPAVHTKSGLMLGLGETWGELLDTLADLREAGVEMLTLGQYLQPSPESLPVVRFLHPHEFGEIGRAARRMGFLRVASGPFVRSSYHAREMMVPLDEVCGGDAPVGDAPAGDLVNEACRGERILPGQG